MSRASEEAVKAGLSTDAPHSKRTLDELEKTVGPEKAKGIAKENKVQLIAPGRPLLPLGYRCGWPVSPEAPGGWGLVASLICCPWGIRARGVSHLSPLGDAG